mmetsp:Transcript_3650/g.5285  ORF Transcript_3650/g.5285 Transcript_3650/m.5285 type:complete len:493 (+) Transcript_3650:97-1575(+)
MGNIITTTPNEVAIVSGCRGTRMLIGKCGFQMWFIETCKRLSLELMTLEIKSRNAETIKGVRVNCGSVAQIKVKAFCSIPPGTPAAEAATFNILEHDFKSITVAATHFLGEDESTIRDAILRTMEGHQRQILGTLTVEEIYKDRAAFSEKVRDLVYDDLKAMGFELVSYTVTDIDDNNGYMESLGATQTALVKREAAEGQSRNQAEARKKVAQYDADAEMATAEAMRESHIAVNSQKQAEAESDRDLQMKQQAYDAEVNRARAEAEAAGPIEAARQEQAVIREKTQQRVVEAEVQLQIADREVQKQQKEAEGTSLADLMAQKNHAEAKRISATAEADRIRMLGDAQAAALEAKGAAEAAVLDKKAQAWKHYGDAALVQMVVDKLPEIAANMAKPLEKTKEMVFVSTDGSGPSQLTSDISKMMATLPATVHGLTGVDIREIIKRKAAGSAIGEDAAKFLAGADISEKELRAMSTASRVSYDDAKAAHAAGAAS